MYGSVLLLYAAYVHAYSFNLTWDSSSSSSEGIVYYSLCWRSQISSDCTGKQDVGTQNSYTFDSNNFEKGQTYYFTVRTYSYDSTGQRIESDLSKEVSKTIE